LALIVSIGGTDYGPTGLDLVQFPGGLQLEQAGRNRIGTATIRLAADAANAIAILDKDEVQIYLSGGTPQCLFGGFVSHRATYREKGTSQEFWEIQCQDYNLLLDTVVGQAAAAQAVNVSAGNFADQIADLVLGIQQGSVVLNPAKLINTALSSSTGYVEELIVSTTTLPAFSSKGESLRQAIDRWLQTNVVPEYLLPALRPHYHLALLPNGVGVECCLVMYDAANAPAATKVFSDTPGVGEHEIYSFRRVRDGSSLAERQQTFYGDPLLQVLTYADTAATAAPNPYIHHGRTGSKGYWMDVPDSDRESPNVPAAENRLEALVLAKSQPRETIELVEDGVFVRPGETVTVDFSSEGLLTDYSVVGVGVEYITPSNIRYHLTLGLPQRELLEGAQGIQGPPVEIDIIPPDPPTSFALVSNLYNPLTGRSELTFSWAASPSADTLGYVLRPAANSAYPSMDVGEVLTATYEYGPAEAYSFTLVAYDGRRNISEAAGPLTGTAASAIYERLQNGGAEAADRTDTTLPRYWTRTVNGTCTATRDTTEVYEGQAAFKLVTDTGATASASLTSAAFVPPAPRTAKYRLACWAMASNAGETLDYVITYLNAGGSPIGSETGSFTLTTSWARYSTTVLGEAGTRIASVQVIFTLATVSTARTVYFDSVSFEPQAVTEDIADDAIDGNKLAPNLVYEAPTEAGALVVRVTDATPVTLPYVLTLQHRWSSGTPSTGFGSRILFQAASNTTNERRQGAIETEWVTATDASRLADMVLRTSNTGSDTILERLRLSNLYARTTTGLVVGNSALGTNATDGFLYLPSSAGKPTGTPTAHTGTYPIEWDSTGKILWLYDGGWKGIIGQGTAFPASPATGQRFYRTDLMVECYYDGTRWLGPQQTKNIYTRHTAPGNYAGTTLIDRFGDFQDASYYLERIVWRARVNTTNNGSNYWTLRVGYEGYTLGGSVLLDVNTSALTVDTYGVVGGAVNTAVDYSALTAYTLFTEVRKDVGAPGSLDVMGVSLTYKRVYT
jgi:hypothetical protein